MSEAPHSIAELIEALQDGDFQIRNEAAVALGELGPAARESVPALTQALEAEDKYLRSHAAAALGKIGPAAGAAVPALTRALKDNDEDVRGEATAALGHLGAQMRARRPVVRVLSLQRHRQSRGAHWLVLNRSSRAATRRKRLCLAAIRTDSERPACSGAQQTCERSSLP